MYYSKLKSISLIRPNNNNNNSENMLLSEKDINAVEFNFLVRPTLEFKHDHHCQISLSSSSSSSEEEDDVHRRKQEEEDRKKEDKFDMLVSTLKLKIPSPDQEFRVLEDQENHVGVVDGFETPTSLDHKIPAALKCPPAPRKPKSLPSMKRRLPISRRRVLLDLTSEIESLFPPAILADLGGKIKKVRQAGSGNILL